MFVMRHKNFMIYLIKASCNKVAKKNFRLSFIMKSLVFNSIFVNQLHLLVTTEGSKKWRNRKIPKITIDAFLEL